MTHRALVTGGTGFIGSRLVRALLARGSTVTILVRPTSTLTQLGDAAHAVRVVRSIDALDDEVRAADVVFSLATSRADASLADVSAIVDAAVRLPTLLAVSCAAARVPLVTSASYMHHPGEVAPTVYSALRAASDPVLAWACTHAQLRCITLSLTSVHGPGDPRPKLLGALLAAARTGEPIDMASAQRRLDFVHVDDVVEAYLRAAHLLADPAFDTGQRFTVSSGECTTLAQVVALIEAVSGRSIDARWGVRPATPSDAIEPPDEPVWLPGWGASHTLRETIEVEVARWSRPESRMRV